MLRLNIKQFPDKLIYTAAYTVTAHHMQHNKQAHSQAINNPTLPHHALLHRKDANKGCTNSTVYMHANCNRSTCACDKQCTPHVAAANMRITAANAVRTLQARLPQQLFCLWSTTTVVSIV